MYGTCIGPYSGSGRGAFRLDRNAHCGVRGSGRPADGPALSQHPAGAPQPRALPNGLAALLREAGLAECPAPLRVDLQQTLQQFQQVRRSSCQWPTPQELSIVAELPEELARPRLRGNPRPLACRHYEEHDAQLEGVCREGVVGALLVHLGCLMGLLATHLPAAGSGRCRHGEIDDPHPHLSTVVCQQNVLWREIAVGNTQLMQPPCGHKHLRNDGLHQGLPLRPQAGRPQTPREEVATPCEAHDNVGAVRVTEDAL
mmetsp:Transcript_102412/g.285389  ORF Transcript_102412/g.285389 Transcript_102412/m.285389 type:complete len:257 (+) Transcript_102412:19-789(+)